MRFRMKVAAIVGFLGVIAALVMSGQMPLELLLHDFVSFLVTALVFVSVCVLIAVYFDRNFNADGSAKKKADGDRSRR